MTRFLVLLAAANVACLSARHGPNGWNDASRLATVEALVEHRTLELDKSIYVKLGAADQRPKVDPRIAEYDTKDRILVNGHYYSHKPPMPAVLLGAAYLVWKQATGSAARDDPRAFYHFMTVVSVGIPYVLSVYALFTLGTRLGLDLRRNLCLCASFGLSTLALVYTRNVNDHMMLLAVGFGIVLVVPSFTGENQRAGARTGFLLGTLAGLGYTMDSGAGAALLAATTAFVGLRWLPARAPLVSFCVAATPWIAAHHVLNYAISGTLRPAGSIMEYYQWPGSPFKLTDVSGAWHHQTFGHFSYYALDMLIGRPGFIGHNLPLALAVVAFPILWKTKARRPELLWVVAWCVATWLLYAAFGACYGGLCCPIRWFIPLLAPAYYLLAALLSERPSRIYDLFSLSAMGAVPTVYWWYQGPFARDDFPWYWTTTCSAIASWGLLCVFRRFSRFRGGHATVARSTT